MSRRVTESVFLSGEYKSREKASTKALILGGDEYGIRIAELLTRDGVPSTVLIGPDETPPKDSRIKIIQGSILSASGFIGNFDVCIQESNDKYDGRFGFIVAAQPAFRSSKNYLFAVSESDKVWCLSAFGEHLESGGKLPERKGPWLHIAFFFDLKGASEISQFEELLSILDRLEIFDQVQSYVFVNNLKVSSEGLDAWYRDHRRRGVVFFKFDSDDPQISFRNKELIIEFVEPLLKEEMELTPDLIVLDEILGPSPGIRPILEMIPSWPASTPYLQPESTRFNGVETQKAGVFAVGPTRGVFDQRSLRADVDAVRVSILKALPELSSLIVKETAFIDRNKCTFCLTCVRLCPHGAIGFDLRPEVDPVSCRSCGVCVVECPMSAIEIRPANAEMIEESKTAPLKLFVCSHSGLQAVSKINSKFLTDVEIIPLSCAGSISPTMMLKAIQEGAKGIVVAGCFKGNCASIYGSTLADSRVAQMVQTLQSVGMDKVKIEFVYLAGNTPNRIVEAITRIKK